MGFRSTFTTEDLRGIKLPRWFVKKWKDDFNFGEYKKLSSPYWRKNTFLINAKFERKMYFGKGEEFIVDIQRVVNDKDVNDIILVALHECGGITRFKIEKNKITLSEPIGWKEVENITHNYCYGCSDIK